jgi:hypothetical protein
MRVKDFAHDDVARRAYELFLSRGEQHGRDLDDWLERDSMRARVAAGARSRRAASRV